MGKELPLKERRVKDIELRFDEQNEDKMIIEGYPIVFDQETYIQGWDDGFYERIDPHAFDEADMTDIVLNVNHEDRLQFLARTRNGSLKYEIDEHGVFMRAELIDTTYNRDIYKMVKAGLLTEGSFAFSVLDDKEEKKDGAIHRTITRIGKVFDFSICTNGAYNTTEIYARSCDLVLEKAKSDVETSCRLATIRSRIAIKIKLLED